MDLLNSNKLVDRVDRSPPPIGEGLLDAAVKLIPAVTPILNTVLGGIIPKKDAKPEPPKTDPKVTAALLDIIKDPNTDPKLRSETIKALSTMK